MYLGKTLTSRSLTDIGRRFGDRDHTTVLHAVRKIDNQVGTNKAMAHEIDTLKQLLRTGEWVTARPSSVQDYSCK